MMMRLDPMALSAKMDSVLEKITKEHVGQTPADLKIVRLYSIFAAFGVFRLGCLMILSVFWFDFLQMVAGILEILIAVLMMSLEAPNSVQKLRFPIGLQDIQRRMISWPFMYHGTLYFLVIHVPVLFDSSWLCILCYSLVLITAILYVVMGFRYPKLKPVLLSSEDPEAPAVHI